MGLDKFLLIKVGARVRTESSSSMRRKEHGRPWVEGVTAVEGIFFLPQSKNLYLISLVASKERLHFSLLPPQGPYKEIFVHISDIEGEFVPRKGDRVSYRLCPIPPRFDKFQVSSRHAEALALASVKSSASSPRPCMCTS